MDNHVILSVWKSENPANKHSELGIRMQCLEEMKRFTLISKLRRGV